MSKNFKNVKKQIKQVRQRSYLNKDFDAFRAELLDYARTYFSDNISDFSEASVGGMFLEMAAYVGDVMSYYLDHQFNELDLQTAVEEKNIERLVRAAGVKSGGASPAVVDVEFSLEVDSETTANGTQPKIVNLPIIQAGTTVSSNTGVTFELGEALDFSEKSSNGNLAAVTTVVQTDSNNLPVKYKLTRTGLCKSGKTITETFLVSDDFKPFRKITIGSENVSEIISVFDDDRNEYYEVESLTQDTVYKRVLNVGPDSDLVSDNLEILSAPYRFIKLSSRKTGLTTLTFGSGDASSADDNIIPDPSEVSLPLFGSKNTMNRFSVDPNSLLKTRTLGLSPRGTKITVRYRAGGGLSHNVGSKSISTVKLLNTKFEPGISSSRISLIRASIVATNPAAASGGESELTINELRSTALAFRNSQSRIVTKQDLISRIYTMPTNFGRVFRIGIRSNQNNPLASTVAIISRDSDNRLVLSPDALKQNLQTYLNEFRLISDAIDIVDARIINIGVRYSIVVDAFSNKELTVQRVNASLKNYLKIENFQIDQPIVISDLTNLILNTDGVLSQISIEIKSKVGIDKTRTYSDQTFNIASNTSRGIVVPPKGSIFELRFPDDDIVGNAE